MSRYFPKYLASGEICQTNERNKLHQNTCRDEASKRNQTGHQAVADVRCEQANLERDGPTDELSLCSLSYKERGDPELSIVSRYGQSWQRTGDYSPG
jgi:hypothetical protein